MDSIRARCGQDRRIRIIAERLTYAQTAALCASCDCYVSLHRSDGSALGPMEAMTRGKPVVATGWSGNLTFMNHANACLVDYRLVPLSNAQALHAARYRPRSARWAEPDVDHAASWMRYLAAHPHARAEIGHRARTDMSAFQRNAERATFVEELAALARSHRLRRSIEPQ